MTLECIKFLHEHGENLYGVVIYDKKRFTGSEFFVFCEENNIRIFEGDEIYN